MKRIPRWPAILLVLLLLAGFGRQGIFWVVEHDAFITPRAGTLTPDAFGAPSQQLSFPSGERTLRASYVRAPDDNGPAVLIFHGDEEGISNCAEVQKRLHDDGISSLVFDYSGFGASTGRPTVENLHQDGLAAWQRFVAFAPSGTRRYVLGFSLRSAVLLDVVNRLQPPPDGIVIASGFASTREVAVATSRRTCSGGSYAAGHHRYPAQDGGRLCRVRKRDACFLVVSACRYGRQYRAIRGVGDDDAIRRAHVG